MAENRLYDDDSIQSLSPFKEHSKEATYNQE